MLGQMPVGYQWRSSQAFIILTAILGLFSESFLFAYIVPILSYMVEVRLRLPQDQTQWITTTLLASSGAIGIILSPITAHFADKTSNRRIPMLLALSGSLVGVVLQAVCVNVWMLFIGRIAQAVFSSAGWLACFAILSDNVSLDHVGKTLGTAMTFVSAGLILAPAVSGTLLQIAGYWATWSAPIVLLTLGLVTGSLMIERSNGKGKSNVEAISEPDSESPLLGGSGQEENSTAVSSLGFYRIVLFDIRIVVGLLNVLAYAIILSSFDTTLPLHAQRTFNWGPLLVGSIFLAIQFPGLVLGPVVGWARDSVGLRLPATIGWILVAVFLCLLGLTGPNFRQHVGLIESQAIFIVGIVGFGFASALVRGGGIHQLVAITKSLEAEKPSIFGPHGATSKMFSLQEIAMELGITIGPLLSGSIVEFLDFSWMIGVLVIISMGVGISSCAVFTHKSKTHI